MFPSILDHVVDHFDGGQQNASARLKSNDTQFKKTDTHIHDVSHRGNRDRSDERSDHLLGMMEIIPFLFTLREDTFTKSYCNINIV